MNLQAGIVESPNVGKFTFFNALSSITKSLASNHRFRTIELNLNLMNVTVIRINELAELVKPTLTIPTQ